MSRRSRPLLWMYPAEFRDAYGDEALRLIEDRWRDERGLARRLRLCIDLGADLLMTRLRPRAALGPAPSTVAHGHSLFGAFARDTSGASTMIPGMVLSLLMVAMFIRLITPNGDHDLGILLQRLFELL